MESTGEYFEILKVIKSEINKDNFVVNKEMFCKDFIKSIIVNNSPAYSLLISLIEKSKINEKNENIFFFIQNLYKKSYKEKKIIIQNLPKFSIFYNQPAYIEKLNTEIYQIITENLKELSKKTKLIKIING